MTGFTKGKIFMKDLPWRNSPIEMLTLHLSWSGPLVEVSQAIAKGMRDTGWLYGAQGESIVMVPAADIKYIILGESNEE